MKEPRRFVDLHSHSTASDGMAGPAEVVRLADAAGLAAVALTDHDTTAGLPEARREAAKFPHLSLVPGIEVSARFSPGILHVLGLGVAEGSGALGELESRFQAARRERNPKIIARLQGMGVRIDMDDVRAVAAPGGRVLGRLHIAEALRRKGYVRTVNEAMARYVGDGAAAFVDKERLEAGEVISLIHGAEAAAVLAHPVHLHLASAGDLESFVRSLVDAGLDGIEAYHSEHTDQQTRLYLDLASRHGLLVTGGSDFHGSAKLHVRLGHPRVPLSVVAGPWARRWFG